MSDRHHTAITLRSLLLAGRLSVSTQQAVTQAPNAVAFALAWWGWLAAVAIAVALTSIGGGVSSGLAKASALALVPAFAGFALAVHLGRRAADAALIVVWLACATALAAGGGGATSPLAALFAVPLALATALGRPWRLATGAVGALGIGLAAWLSRSDPEPEFAAFSALLAAAAIAYSAALLSLSRRPVIAAADASARIAEVSHELRTPLTHILGFAEMIERRVFGDLDERYAEYGGMIRRSGNHLLGLVNDLLDISRIEAGRYPIERELFDARSVVEEVVRLSTDAARRKAITLTMSTPQAPLMVSADVAALRRILINLVGNALKFSPESARVAVSASSDDNALVLEVSDTGPGIPAPQRERVMVAYERGDKRAEGAGLGLSLVRALAALHGGELIVLDALGGGALMRVRLPVLVEKNA